MSLFRRKDPSKEGSVILVGLAVLPFLVLCYIPAFLYVYGGPVACIALAIWRTVQRDYGGGGGDTANLAPALDMFYSLVLLQGGLLLAWLYHDHASWWADHLITLRRLCDCELPNTEWCRQSLVEFLCDTRARCWRDLSSIRGRRLVDYAVGLLDSGSWDDNLSAARLLAEFIRQQRSTVRSLLLPSRPRIQRLIDALGWRDGRRPEDAEMRRLAACILANLAGDLHLSQFPGAIHCITYLLQDEATLAYQQGLTHRPQRRRLASEKEAMVFRLEKREERRRKKEMKGRERHAARLQNHEQEVADGGSSGGGGGSAFACNELILQGLTILERLASDRHNCGEICSCPGLLDKITAPLYSGDLVHNIRVTDDWVQVVNATFKVLYQLIHATGESSARLRAEISENSQAMSNLEAIIRQEAQQELKMGAMEILTELALDPSIDLPRETKRNLMKKQMHIFLNADGDLKATAGRTLVLTKCGDVDSLNPLVGILDKKNVEIKYRIIAAEILENVCVHCEKQRLKETLLPKVLSMIVPSERENRRSENSAPRNNDESMRNPEPGQDEETPPSRDQQKPSDHGNQGQTAAKALQAKLLSLTLVMYTKLEPADFGNALANKGSAFVTTLKQMVEENYQATVGSLNIVKLCGQIAVSMIQSNQYTEYFKNQEFVKSLSKARKIMSNLESCILFAGRDHGLRKMARPLLLDLEKEAQTLVC